MSPLSNPWADRCEELADHAMRNFINRTDVVLCRYSGGGWYAHYLHPDEDYRDFLVQHFRGLCFLAPSAVSIGGTCKWVGIDLDNHGDTPGATERLQYIGSGLVNTLAELGVIALLEKSHAGLHLWITFNRPAPVDEAYRFARWISADCDIPVEANPKQRDPSKISNGLRLPGRHHTHPSLSQLWGDAEWLTPGESVAYWLTCERNPLSVMALMGNYDPDPRPKLPPVSAPVFRDPIINAAEEQVNRMSWAELLGSFGWRHAGGDAWTRPGKDQGKSATVCEQRNRIFVFSTNAPIEGGVEAGGRASYSKWRFYCASSRKSQKEVAQEVTQ